MNEKILPSYLPEFLSGQTREVPIASSPDLTSNLLGLGLRNMVGQRFQDLGYNLGPMKVTTRFGKNGETSFMDVGVRTEMGLDQERKMGFESILRLTERSNGEEKPVIDIVQAYAGPRRCPPQDQIGLHGMIVEALKDPVAILNLGLKIATMQSGIEAEIQTMNLTPQGINMLVRQTSII